MAVVKELDTVVLQNDLPEHGLVKGDVGAVVHVYDDGAGFEVEFVDADGRTVAVETLDSRDVTALEGRKILHVRPLGPR